MKTNQTMKEFEEALQKDENLRKEFEAQCKKAAESGECANDLEVLVKAAGELGWTLEFSEIEQEKASGEELDLEELEKISGGDYVSEDCFSDWGCLMAYHTPDNEDENGHTEWCVTGWHCNTITCHTDSVDKAVYCWSQYACFMVLNDSEPDWDAEWRKHNYEK